MSGQPGLERPGCLDLFQRTHARPLQHHPPNPAIRAPLPSKIQ